MRSLDWQIEHERCAVRDAWRSGFIAGAVMSLLIMAPFVALVIIQLF